MKKPLLFILAALMTVQTFAQDANGSDTLEHWKITGGASLLFNQVGLYRWQGGGDPSISVGFVYKGTFDYNSFTGWEWKNYIDIAYGIIKKGKEDLDKSDDRWEVGTQLSRDLSKRWRADVFANLKSQFTIGYDPDNKDLKISNLMAPGYLFAGIGADFNENDWLFINVSPLTYKGTYVLDQEIADYDIGGEGKYGNEPGQRFRHEFGIYGKIQIKKELVKNVFLDTKAEFFSDYAENFGVFDVFWDLTFMFKVNNWLAASFTMNMIYDQDIPIILETNNLGEPTHIGPSAQVKETVGIGITVTY